MAALDVTGYVDLTLYDLSAQDIAQAMFDAAQLRWPDWNQLEAHNESQFLEVIAERIAVLHQGVNRIPAATFEGWLRLLQILRDPGTRPVLTLTFTAADTLGHVVPAGTRVRFTPADGSDPIAAALDADLTIAVGVATGSGTATADIETARLNGTTAGAVALLDAVTFVDAVALTAAITAGRDPETSSAYLDRGARRLSRLTSTLVHSEDFAAAALENSNVVNAVAVDNFNSDLGTGSPGDHPGHTTVAVSGPDGDPLSAPDKAALLATLEDQALALLIVHIADSTVTTVNVAANLKRLPEFTDAQVKTDAESAVRAYLDPDTWIPDRTVYVNELVSLLNAVAGVDVPLAVTSPAANVVLTGIGTLVKAGTVAITTTL